ncbi:MAG: DUF4276 family protein [Planctomycetia bacterium]|nr:DUF4276 family protein [Planctomycetia bacterium]
MKFVLLVEGQTERDSAAAFLKRWLGPQLNQPVGIQTVPFDGYADLLRKMATKAKMHLEAPQRNEIVAVIGMLDLYGPTFNFMEPPAKLLDRIYKQVTKRSYKKTTYGKQLFAKLDPAVAITKCPNLKTMRDEMLSLAKAAGL